MLHPSKPQHRTFDIGHSRPAQASALFQGVECAVLCFLWEPTNESEEHQVRS